MNTKVKVYISYVEEDNSTKETLERFLFGLKHSEKIEVWNARKVLAGGNEAKESEAELRAADLIILIISIDFINSEKIWANQLKIAMQRHATMDARVIPIRARSANWSYMPFEHISGLPADGTTISASADKDKTYTEIADAIRAVVEEVGERKVFKSMTFGDNLKSGLPKIFFSVGTPHTMIQATYVQLLKDKFMATGFELVTLQDKDWNPDDPIGPIYKLIKKCSGCIVLLLERYYIETGRVKRGSDNEKPMSGIAMTTPWNQIEATLAYTEKLPLLILKDKNVLTDGVFEDHIKKFKHLKINTDNFDEWQLDDRAYIFEEFLEKVKAIKK